MNIIGNIGVDVVFNITEGRKGRNRESQVPMLLELFNIPYIGSDALTMGLTLDKVIAKRIFISEGIPTPEFDVIDDVSEFKFNDIIKFPIIVKPRYEGSSKSLSKDSIVYFESDLRRQALFINQTYNQPALIEEFIRGREFTVAVLGNDNAYTLPIIQIQIDGKLDLGSRFYDYSMIQSDELQYICPAQIDINLENKINELALRVYKAVECKDFGRIDFRVDKHDNVYVLEINPLPGLNDVFLTLANTMNKEYDDILLQILEEGLRRLKMEGKLEKF
jgi:D-alanine-D-alanine ligase